MVSDRNNFEVELDEEDIAALKRLSERGLPLNLGSDDDPLWVTVEWLDDDSVRMRKATQDEDEIV